MALVPGLLRLLLLQHRLRTLAAARAAGATAGEGRTQPKQNPLLLVSGCGKCWHGKHMHVDVC